MLSIVNVKIAFCGLEVDLSYWRLSSAKTTFDESVSETSDQNRFSDLDLTFSEVTTIRSLDTITSDASKYLFDISYVFEDILPRLRAGIQYAGTGNAEVKDVSWINQPEELKSIITDRDFSADKFTYTNFYLAYKLFPLESSNYSTNYVKEGGMNLLLTWTQFEQKYSLLYYMGTRRKLIEYTTNSKSLGIGFGGESKFNDKFSLNGRIVYLPFYDFPGSGWDSEIKIKYNITDSISVYMGGKWFRLNVELNKAIGFIVIPNYPGDVATYKTLNVDLGGYTIGASIKF